MGRRLNADLYETGTGPGDNHDPYIAHNNDMGRWTTYYPDTPSASLTPMQDRPGFTDGSRFGSAHSSGCQFAFCDGSIRTVGFATDPLTHSHQGNRQDGQVIDLP